MSTREAGMRKEKPTKHAAERPALVRTAALQDSVYVCVCVCVFTFHNGQP